MALEQAQLCNAELSSTPKREYLFGHQKSSRGAAFVAMMQATNLREGDNVSRGGWVYRARFRTILVKREMGSGLVMILKIRRQNPAQLALIEDDDVIETFAAD